MAMTEARKQELREQLQQIQVKPTDYTMVMGAPVDGKRKWHRILLHELIELALDAPALSPAERELREATLRLGEMYHDDNYRLCYGELFNPPHAVSVTFKDFDAARERVQKALVAYRAEQAEAPHGGVVEAPVPCHCGAIGILVYSENYLFKFQCVKCMEGYGGDTIEQATARWNTANAATTAVPENENMRNQLKTDEDQRQFEQGLEGLRKSADETAAASQAATTTVSEAVPDAVEAWKREALNEMKNLYGDDSRMRKLINAVPLAPDPDPITVAKCELADAYLDESSHDALERVADAEEKLRALLAVAKPTPTLAERAQALLDNTPDGWLRPDTTEILREVAALKGEG